MDAEDGHRDGDGQLEIVRSGGEGQGRRLAVGGAGLAAQPEGDQEHHREIDQQRQGDAHHVQRDADDGLALEAEHDHDGEEQGDQRDGRYLRDEARVVPLLALGLDQHQAGQHAGQEGDAQVDEDALGDAAHGHRRQVDLAEAQPDERRQLLDEEPGEERIEQHLEDAVEGHQPGGVLAVAVGQVVPDDDHGDAARQADHDQADQVFRLVGQEDDRQGEHQQRADDPVLQQREPQHLQVAEDVAQLLVLHLGQRRVHHQDQADGDGHVGGAGVEAVPEADDPREEVSQPDADGHGQEDPHRQVAVEERQPLSRRFSHEAPPCLSQ